MRCEPVQAEGVLARPAKGVGAELGRGASSRGWCVGSGDRWRCGAGPGAVLASAGGRPATSERRLGAWAGVEQLSRGGRRVLAWSGSVAVGARAG
jgi:hypothetical protein